MQQSGASSPGWPRILSEDLVAPVEPLALLLAPGAVAAPCAVACRAARGLLGLSDGPRLDWPAWLAPHQRPAAERLAAILERQGGALLADAVGLGKSYVALAVALARRQPFTLVVPAVLVPQWRALLARHDTNAPLMTHEALSAGAVRLTARDVLQGSPRRLVLVDEAHRFRNPDTRRYRALARLAVGAAVLLVTATPVHNRIADLFHLFRLFLRDHDLAALGVPSLRRAARGDVDRETLAAVAARLSVARSRERVREGYARGPVVLDFPDRAPGERIRAGTASPPLVAACVAGIARLRTGGAAGALFRTTLLRRLASSLPAFRASLDRYEAFLALAGDAARDGRTLDAREFRKLIAPGDVADAQLALWPLVLPVGGAAACAGDLGEVRRLRALAHGAADPKADALVRLLRQRDGKTIVFADAVATVRHLLRRLAGLRACGIVGERALFAGGPARRGDALRAFAPRAQGAAPPPRALAADVLIATDLLSEGLNLQDAERVVHYDLPWSPARLAQRVGRVDRLGSPHRHIETVTFFPPAVIGRALALERRLAAKARAQAEAGAAQVESARGRGPAVAALDWCDRLHALERGAHDCAPHGSSAAALGEAEAVVCVLRIGGLTEAVVVVGGAAHADPRRATALLERAAHSRPLTPRPDAIRAALRRVAPLVRTRLDAVAAARWRAGDRDQVARRLIPWVLTAAGRAARRRDAQELARLDAVLARLAHGMTAGEELLLERLLARRTAISVDHLVAWHERLPPVRESPDAVGVELVAALEIRPAAGAR